MTRPTAALSQSPRPVTNTTTNRPDAVAGPLRANAGRPRRRPCCGHGGETSYAGVCARVDCYCRCEPDKNQKGHDPMKCRDWKTDLYEVSLAIQQAERTLKAATREHKNTIRELKEDRDRILSAIESGQMELGDDVRGGE